MLVVATGKPGNINRLTIQEFVLHSWSQEQVGRGSLPSNGLKFKLLHVEVLPGQDIVSKVAITGEE